VAESPVFCTDSQKPAGRLWGRAPERHQDGQLLVATGRWIPTVRRVPEALVSTFSEQAVHLRVTTDQFLRLPLYRPDSEVAANVHRSFRGSQPLRLYGTSSIAVSVTDGVVTLAGHIPNDRLRDEAITRASRAEGVVRVEDQLVVDEELASAVAIALTRHPSLQPSKVHVSADLGTVALAGELETEQQVHLAVVEAEQVPGVVRVDNRLRVREPDHKTSPQRRQGPIVLFFGSPGSGKSTVGRYVAAKLGVPWISAGLELRVAAIEEPWMAPALAAGRLLPDADVNRVILGRLTREGTGFVLDGYPRSAGQAMSFLDFLRERSWRIDLAYRLRVPPEVVVQRLQARRRLDDVPEAIWERLHLYWIETEPVVGLLEEKAGVAVVDVDNAGPMKETERRLDETLRALLVIASGAQPDTWDEVVVESFPASDPPPWPGSIGAPD
jgi:adenylate kinase